MTDIDLSHREKDFILSNLSSLLQSIGTDSLLEIDMVLLPDLILVCRRNLVDTENQWAITQ
jgi:hypothetical protein